MTSDIYRYVVKELGFDEVVGRMDGAVALNRLSFIQRTENRAIYSCDWVEGPYVDITSQEGRVNLTLDGSSNGFGGAESLLKEILGVELIDEE